MLPFLYIYWDLIEKFIYLYKISNRMFVYNPHNEKILANRIKKAETLLKQIPTKHCFITGSFLYKKNYNDIDIFVITRSKRKLSVHDKKAKITIVDFNNQHSLFYHSISKSCISKSLLPTKPLKVTISDYWGVINESVPTIINHPRKLSKNIRFLILYTEFFKTGEILDTYQLDKAVIKFTTHQKVLDYIKMEVPAIIKNKIKHSYIKRFFYTQAGHYKTLDEYKAQRFLYDLSHSVVGVV